MCCPFGASSRRDDLPQIRGTALKLLLLLLIKLLKFLREKVFHSLIGFTVNDAARCLTVETNKIMNARKQTTIVLSNIFVNVTETFFPDALRETGRVLDVLRHLGLKP